MKVQLKPEQAKRLMRKLDLPGQAAEVLTEAKYWSEAFCVLYFDRCDDVSSEDPRAAIPMAATGLVLARRVSSQHCGERRLRELAMRALACQGTAFRAAGRLEDSDRSYEEALSIESVSDLERADLLGRLAVLRKYQHRFDEAEKLLGRVIGICEKEDSNEQLGRFLAVRGAFFLSQDRIREALQDLSAALLHLDEKRNQREHDATLQNLAACLYHDKNARLEDLAETLRALKRSRRKRRAGTTVPKLKLRWLEGLIEIRFGFTGRGELSLRGARRGLVQLRMPFDAALVSLDLSLLYLEEERYEEMQRLAAETYRIFQALSADRDAQAALLLWKQAVQRQILDSEVVIQVRKRIQNRMAPGSSSPLSI